MDLKTLLLLKLVCCGGVLLILLLPWGAVSAILARLGGEVWYGVGAALVVAGVLLWLFDRRQRPRQAGEREDPPRPGGRVMDSDQPSQPVTLYTQAGCAESGKVRAWLVEHGIAFTEQDASRDMAAAAALAATGIFATPLLVVGETKVLGFRLPALAALPRASDHPDSVITPTVRP